MKYKKNTVHKGVTLIELMITAAAAAVIVIGIGTILYYEGIRLIKAAQVSALELSTPFFATFLGYLVLREVITSMQFLGILLLLAGIYFLSKKEKTTRVTDT